MSRNTLLILLISIVALTVPSVGTSADEETASGSAAPASDAVFEDGKATGRVLAIDHLGNLETSFVAEDLKRLDLELGDPFVVRSSSREAKVLVGESVFDARLGEWVAFISLEGRLIVSRSYGRAVTALETDIDEPIEIRPLNEAD